MPKFSEISAHRLETCHPDLQRVFNEVIKLADCSIICGHRNQEDQDAAFAAGNSHVKWPNGNHNAVPSNAVDVCPWPIDWKDEARFRAFAAIVKDVAKGQAVAIQWGGDWTDFQDFPHWELKHVDNA